MCTSNAIDQKKLGENTVYLVSETMHITCKNFCKKRNIIWRIFTFLFVISGTTLSIWLCWWPQVWTLFDTGLDARQALPRIFWLNSGRRCSESRSCPCHCVRMHSQKFRSHFWMFCFTAQLLFSPILFGFSRYWFLLWV